MTAANGPSQSVSTWSLHRALGVTYPDSPDGTSAQPVETYGPGTVPLLDIPARIAEMGIRTMEICHFHLPKGDAGYLRELRAAIESAGVKLLSVLIDAGDITHPTQADRNLAWTGEWVDIAGQLGAERARVIAGRAECSDETFAQSRRGLHALTHRGQEAGVRITTENWFALLSRPETVNRLLESLEGAVGLNLDFGNWGGPTKYDDLAAIFPRAESCHAKCAFSAPQVPDAADYGRCLDLAREAGFTGPLTLIYDGPDDNEWEGLKLEQAIVRPYLSTVA